LGEIPPKAGWRSSFGGWLRAEARFSQNITDHRNWEKVVLED